MKALLLLIFLISFFFSKSQNTTEEEYNWMNKGYKVMITSGLDMKRGYFFDEDLFYKNILGNYEIEFKFLKREKDKSTAGILIISKSINNGNYNYCGLPLGEDFSDKFDGSAMDSIAGKGIYEQSFLFDQFLISLNAMDFYQKSAINNAIFDFFTQYYLRSINKK